MQVSNRLVEIYTGVVSDVVLGTVRGVVLGVLLGIVPDLGLGLVFCLVLGVVFGMVLRILVGVVPDVVLIKHYFKELVTIPGNVPHQSWNPYPEPLILFYFFPEGLEPTYEIQYCLPCGSTLSAFPKIPD